MLLRLSALLLLLVVVDSARTPKPPRTPRPPKIKNKYKTTTELPVVTSTGAGNIDENAPRPYSNRCYGYRESSNLLKECQRKKPGPTDKGPGAPTDPPCPSPLNGHSLETFSHFSQAKLRSCPSSEFETLTQKQVEALDDNTLMMEKSTHQPTKLANLIEQSSQDEVDAVPWEHVAGNMNGDVFPAMTDTAFEKMPSERVLPHLQQKEFEKVDINKCLTHMDKSEAEDMDWHQVGYKMTPEQMKAIEPANAEKMQFNNMWEYMDQQTINEVTPDQFKTLQPKQLENMNERAIANLKPQTLAQLSGDQVAGMDDTSKLYSITPQQASLLSESNPDVFGQLPQDTLNKMDPAAVKQLSPKAIDSIGAEKLQALKPQQLAQIKPSTIDQVDPSLVNQLDLSTLEQIASNFN